MMFTIMGTLFSSNICLANECTSQPVEVCSSCLDCIQTNLTESSIDLVFFPLKYSSKEHQYIELLNALRLTDAFFRPPIQ